MMTSQSTCHRRKVELQLVQEREMVLSGKAAADRPVKLVTRGSMGHLVAGLRSKPLFDSKVSVATGDVALVSRANARTLENGGVGGGLRFVSADRVGLDVELVIGLDAALVAGLDTVLLVGPSVGHDLVDVGLVDVDLVVDLVADVDLVIVLVTGLLVGLDGVLLLGLNVDLVIGSDTELLVGFDVDVMIVTTSNQILAGASGMPETAENGDRQFRELPLTVPTRFPLGTVERHVRCHLVTSRNLLVAGSD